MKKVKIMLISIAVLAVVGAALAYKAKYQESFCYTESTIFNNQPTCTTLNGVVLDCDRIVKVGRITDADNGTIGCTAPLDPVVVCDTKCPNLAFTYTDN